MILVNNKVFGDDDTFVCVFDVNIHWYGYFMTF